MESLASFRTGRTGLDGVAIGYGGVPAPRIAEGLRRLAGALRSV